MNSILTWLHRSIRIRRLRRHHNWAHRSRVVFAKPAYDARNVAQIFMENCVWRRKL